MNFSPTIYVHGCFTLIQLLFSLTIVVYFFPTRCYAQTQTCSWFIAGVPKGGVYLMTLGPIYTSFSVYWRHQWVLEFHTTCVCFFCVCLSVCLCLSRCLSGGRFNYEGLMPRKRYFAGTLLGMSSCASNVSRTHDVIDDGTRSQSRSNFEIDILPSIFELERRSKAQNVGNAYGYLSGILNFRYDFR